MEKLRVIELFAGIGAWAKALENLGINHEVVAAVEFDKKTMDCYNVVHRSAFEASDITKLNASEMPECDVICYSPPCQSFSIAGNGKGIDDARGTLFYDALRIIAAKKPKYALMENVKGLTQKAHKHTFDDMLKCLENIGYTNHWKVLNSKEQGTPQNRERVFIVSIRNDINQPFIFPEPIELTKKLEDILEPDATLPILSNIYGGFGEKKPRIFYEYSPTIRTAKGGGHIPSATLKYGDCIDTRQQGLDGVPRYYTDGVHPTIPGTFYKEPTKVVGDNGIRKLSSLECLRLQSFSDEDHRRLVEAKMSNSQIYKVAGNSIDVNVVERLFKELLCPSMHTKCTEEVS